MKVTAIVPAAGIGKRMSPASRKSAWVKKGVSPVSVKSGARKPFFILGGKPILAHTLFRLQRSPYIDDIIVLLDRRDIGKAEKLVKNYRLNKVIKLISGGKTRFESVRKGLSCVGDDTDLVFIHDGVRPFPSSSVISKTVKTAAAFGSAVAATPTASTIKIVKKQKFVTFTPDRNNLWIIGTPQVFRRKLLLKAYKKAGRRPGRVFDDSSLVERLGAKVKVVLDSYENIKITTPLDLVIGEAILRNGGKK